MSSQVKITAAVLLIVTLVDGLHAGRVGQSNDNLDTGMIVEYKVKDLMSPMLYKILKSSGHDLFADGTVKGNVRADNFKFEFAKPEFNFATEFNVGPPATTTTERVPNTPAPVLLETSTFQHAASIIGNAPLPQLPPGKRGVAEEDRLGKLDEVLRKLLSQI